MHGKQTRSVLVNQWTTDDREPRAYIGKMTRILIGATRTFHIRLNSYLEPAGHEPAVG